jgi:hypothetical protein
VVVINFDRRFQNEVVEVIENSLSSIWGKDVSQVIFYNFSKDHERAKEEIVRNPELFDATLERIFDKAGARFVRQRIIREVGSHFQLSGEEIEQASTFEQIILLAWKARQRESQN